MRIGGVVKPATTSDSRIGAWLAAIVVGVASALMLMPLDVIYGQGGLWRVISGDNAQSLSMHIALQTDSWRFPPLFAENVFWPHGVALSIGDLNPLMSLIAKTIAHSTVLPWINLMGVWFAACFVLLPVACVYAVRGLGARSLTSAIGVAMLGALTPTLFFRLGHINLCGHFVFVLALGVSLRLQQRPSATLWWAAFAVLLLGVLTHPYLFMLSAALLAAPSLDDAWRQRVWRTRRPNWPLLGRTALLVISPVVILTVASGGLGGGDKGFGKYSMNLLSLVWPQHSGLFGADLPVLDATGGQYEGFAYLGGGVLLTTIIWLALRPWRRAADYRGLIAVLVLLFLLALGSRIFAGTFKVLDLGLTPWESLFAVFRTNGRAIWPVVYALMLASVAGISRLGAVRAIPILTLAIGLQWVDTGPLRAEAVSYFAGHYDGPALPLLPVGASLLSTAPAPGCTANPIAVATNAPLLLASARAGLKLGDVGLGRQPKWFNCEKFLSNYLEGPMLPGELRAFTDPTYWPLIRVGVFGRAQCAKDSQIVLCASGTAAPSGVEFPQPGPESVPTLAPGLALGLAPSLAPYLGFGWKPDEQGVIWSEGPRMSLRLRPDAASPQTLRLTLDAIAFSQGGTRDLTISLNGTVAIARALPDGATTIIDIDIPVTALIHGVAWVALDVNRPVDPARRGLNIPVSRAALRLRQIELIASPANP